MQQNYSLFLPLIHDYFLTMTFFSRFKKNSKKKGHKALFLVQTVTLF